ncbi:NACHT domain-containing protein [Mesorhizobium sp. B3-1-9]|uniref:NACHT domain-containing protein n=1 Tax=Mesorhizobium sp. B3-1-9 TaxID=2589892 RepID=UPI00112666C4|nr:NACHT domain-containing protein [Mesorhizobium sp. B3-1-9]TPI34869.1 NACHT domain-containing protein [Mesorhizobium sp. B3-1-9]
MGFLETIATQGFGHLLTKLVDSYIQNKSNQISSDKDEIKTDLGPHLSAAFEKCTKLKTILSDEIINFLDIYSDQNFSSEGLKFDQYDLVSKIRENSSSVIVGTGGGGKSMFMRYLWLSYFEDPRGKIPFFLELRQLNRFTHESIEDFIFHTIIKSGSKISQPNFQRSLHQGHFILFLDGFDEINFEKRQPIENLIINLKSAHPKLTIIVTSRPDDRFSGWHQFHIVKVEPLDKKKAIQLLEKAPFDNSKIDKIVSKIKTDHLYDTHTSFLSNPLLAYMMLVTFSYNPDIPKKMFLFYEQAFEALYHRHDLTKGGYSRQFHSTLDKQEFIRQLSYFCLTSYYDEAFEFRDETLRLYVERAKSIEGSTYDSGRFIKDVMESICLLKKEGIEYDFTHRSFQEYFAAYCIARVASRNVERIFEKFAARYNDQVLGMVYDINKDLFREKYIIPMRKAYKKIYDMKSEVGIPEKYFREISGRFTITRVERKLSPSKSRRPRERDWQITLNSSGNFDAFDRNIQRLADDYFPEEEDKVDRVEDEAFARRLFRQEVEVGTTFDIWSDGAKFNIGCQGQEIVGGIDKFRWKESYMYYFVASRALRNYNFVNRENQEYKSVTTSFADFFG